MTGSDELFRIADHIAWMFPEEAHALMKLADEHRRMEQALDDLVRLSYDLLRAREESTTGRVG